VGQLVSLSIHLPVALPPVSVEMAVVRWTDRYLAGLEWMATTEHERMKFGNTRHARRKPIRTRFHLMVSWLVPIITLAPSLKCRGLVEVTSNAASFQR
jgi:hypothetical protein